MVCLQALPAVAWQCAPTWRINWLALVLVLTFYGCHLLWLAVGWAAQEIIQKRGFLDDFRLGCELAVSATFEAVRTIVRKIFIIPEGKPHKAQASVAHTQVLARRSVTCHDGV